ncbi:hypothetical protein GCM10009527_009610 [Actinomadura nitritigenes]
MIARALARLENVGTNSCPTFSRRLIFATYPGTHASGAFVTGAFSPDDPDASGDSRWAGEPDPPPAHPASGSASAAAAASASRAAPLRRGRRRAVPARRDRLSADMSGMHLTRPPDMVVCSLRTS